MNFLHNQPAIATTNILPASFLQQDTTRDFGVKQATGLNVPIIGVSHAGTRVMPNLPETLGGATPEYIALAGDGVGIYGIGDVCLITVGTAAVTAGDFLRNDLNGNAIPAGAGQYYGAKAWQSGQPGEQIQALVLIGTL